MSGTVIDSLVVLFGLDPTGYKKGADEVAKAQAALDAKQSRGVTNTDKEEKALAAARKKRQQQLSKEGNDTVKSFMDIGKAISGVFLGFETATGFAKWMAELNGGEAQLGRTSAKIGMGVHELNKWGNATKLAGGKAEDAQEAFGKIATEFNTSKVTGQIGPLLTFLRARGVAVADANGQMRNQGQILEELADKTAQYGAVYQSNMFRQAGLNEGEISYLIQSKALREEQLRIAEKNNGLTEEQVREAQRLQQKWNDTSEAITRAGQHVLEDLSPAILGVLNMVGNILDDFNKIGGMGVAKKLLGIGDVTPEEQKREDTNGYSLWQDILGNDPYAGDGTAKEQKAPERTGPPAPADWENKTYSQLWNDFLKGMGNSVSFANAQYDSASRAVDPWQKHKLLGTISATEQQLGIPAGLLARIAEQESHFRPDIISGHTKSYAGAVGLMQLLPKYFPGAGKSPEADIATAGKELVRLYKVFGDWSKAVAAYNDGEGNEKKVLAGTKRMPEETRKYLAAVAPTPGINGGTKGGGAGGDVNTTTVAANITVNSSSADPVAVADATAAALQRKMSAAQAFQGQS